MNLALLLAVMSALWLGILTSISPCPLATNIAAVSYISRRVVEPRWVLVTGLLYAFGRMVTYAAIAALLVYSILAAPGVSQWLQKYINLFVGPLLILVGMVLLDLLSLNLGRGGWLEGMKAKSERLGTGGGFLLGVLFALSFCPTSAALYFGALLPLSMREGSPLLLPLAYGLGTALPVIGFAALLSCGASQVGAAYRRLADIDRWTRLMTGLLMLGVGLYLTISHSLRIL